MFCSNRELEKVELVKVRDADETTRNFSKLVSKTRGGVEAAEKWTVEGRRVGSTKGAIGSISEPSLQNDGFLCAPTHDS